jgi:hypothetical protein
MVRLLFLHVQQDCCSEEDQRDGFLRHTVSRTDPNGIVFPPADCARSVGPYATLMCAASDSLMMVSQ